MAPAGRQPLQTITGLSHLAGRRIPRHDVAQDLALVLDYLDSAETHTYTQTWHLAPGETFTQNGLDIVATNAKGVQNLALHQAIAGSKLVVMPGLGHECHLESADGFEAEVRSFLTSLGT